MISDPIVALATPPGRAALAVVRLSGTGAFEVAARVVRGLRPDRPRVAQLAAFVEPDGQTIDHGLCTVFPGPHSYTGEDLVELTCHGGLLAPGRLLAALEAAGARAAAPGEFTRRAVLNGKMDLLQAESVADLIDASTRAQARAALHLMEGGLSRRIEELREQLLHISAHMSYDIDFPEEDDGPLGKDEIRDRLDAVQAEVGRLLATAPAGERLRNGALVVLAGRANAGKSSLFNALLGTGRALVAATPGTTRDAIEADTDFAGWPIRLADTAGLREADDLVERMGIEVSRRYLEAADLVLLCVEAGRPLEAGEREILATRPSILARTKVDLADVPDEPVEGEGVPVSVVSGEGLEAIRSSVADRIFGVRGTYPVPDLDPVLLRERHRTGLARAGEELARAVPHLQPHGDTALASHHLRQALASLDDLIGVVDAEEVLGRVFSRFCVGK
jgi:tRNA modification GTPase